MNVLAMKEMALIMFGPRTYYPDDECRSTEQKASSQSFRANSSPYIVHEGVARNDVATHTS